MNIKQNNKPTKLNTLNEFELKLDGWIKLKQHFM